ncbi:MAG: MlaA family lipoprotein [Alphaproteobacteria bacterium]
MPGRLRSLIDISVCRRLAVALAVLFALSACAGQDKDTPVSSVTGESADIYEIDEIDDDNDPLETVNRFIFAFDLTLDVFIFKPAAATYRFLLPVEVRDSVRNVIRNLRSPVVVANDLFQGEMERAETTAMRFLINTTVGVLGIIDVADGWGYPHHDEDFGQTLAVHGTGEGFYLVLPIFGPSSARDGIGLLVDTFLDPLTYVGQIYDIDEALLARTALGGIDTRSRNIDAIDDLQRDSIDFYARIRSLYRQSRANDIRNGVSDDSQVPGLYSSELDFGDDADSSETTTD